MAISKERIEYLALIAEIIGGLGVIISVIYLALQVGDGNKELRAQNHRNALDLAQRPFEMLVEDREIAQIYVKGRSNFESLSEDERERLRLYNFILFNSWEFSYYQNVEDTIPPELWFGHDGYMRSEVRTNPGFVRSWKDLLDSFDDPFKTYVNEVISAGGSPVLKD
jgi:hypothetical protein